MGRLCYRHFWLFMICLHFLGQVFGNICGQLNILLACDLLDWKTCGAFVGFLMRSPIKYPVLNYSLCIYLSSMRHSMAIVMENFAACSYDCRAAMNTMILTFASILCFDNFYLYNACIWCEFAICNFEIYDECTKYYERLFATEHNVFDLSMHH